MNNDLTLPAGTFARHWLLAAHETDKFKKRVSAAIARLQEKKRQPNDAERRRMNNASTLAQMMELGGAAELCRLMQWRFDQAQKFRLAAVGEYLNVVLEVLDEEDEFFLEDKEFEWEKMELHEEYAEPYFGILTEALKMFAKANGLDVVVFTNSGGGGYVDETYWDAEIRLYQGDEFITIPFFLLSDEFGGRGSSMGDYIGEMYGLDVRYSESTEEEVTERDQMEALESDGLDVTDLEAIDTIIEYLRKGPASSIVSDLLDWVTPGIERDTAERQTQLEEVLDAQAAITHDDEKVTEALAKWDDFEPYQRERLLDVGFEQQRWSKEVKPD